MAEQSSLLSLANEHARAGRRDEADKIYCEILSQNPDRDDIWHQRGVLSLRAQDFELAQECLERAIQLRPDVARHHNAMAVICQSKKNLPRAFAELEKAIQLQPDYVEALNNLGNAYSETGKPEEAVPWYRSALNYRPDHPSAHSNLGAVLWRLGNPQEGAIHLRRACELRPEDRETRTKLTTCLRETGRLDEATTELLARLQRWPNDAEAHVLLATVLFAQKKMSEAQQHYEIGLQLEPNSGFVLKSLGVFSQHMGRVRESADYFRRAIDFEPENAAVFSALLFSLTHDPSTSPAEVFAEHREFERRYAEPADAQKYRNRVDPERSLRVGYVSADFRHHAMMRFIEPVLAKHDSANFEVFCYAEVRSPDAGTAHYQKLVPNWRSTCGLSNDRVAEMITNDEIDILVDLAGHTGGNRLPVFARRPAPVQVAYLGYPNTTGLTSIEYRVTDKEIDPPRDACLATEHMVYLERGVTCLAQIADAPEVSPPPAIANQFVTFGSMHRLSKLSEPVLDLWARLLRSVPNAKLLLLRDTLQGPILDDLAAQFERRGVERSRLEMSNDFGPKGHLGAFARIDISLDTFPYAGYTISCESMWMGVPFITLRGDRPLARAGASLLHSVGLPELIAESTDDYVRIAQELSGDLSRLAALRAELRPRMQRTLCDAVGYTRDLEAAYRTMWQTWCQRQAGADHSAASGVPR